MSQDPNESKWKVKAVKILEINPDHPSLQERCRMSMHADPEKLKDYASVLYDQALLIQGLPIEDPVAYAKKIAELLVKA
jgi:molecular chaperone HtpG